MPSIHDVAKLAGVSTATVSKHINKKGYISPPKRDLIDAAIAQLHYRPNRSAKQLRTLTSGEILYIVPNMNEKVYREIFESVNVVLGEKYRLIIQFTNDRPEKERKILQESLNNPCAGILLCTCVPEDTSLLAKVMAATPLLFLLRRPAGGLNADYAGFDQRNTIFDLTGHLIDMGYEDIGLYTDDTRFSNEAEAVAAFRAAFAAKGRRPDDKRILSLPFSRESVFRNAMRLFDGGQFPRVLLTSAYPIAAAVREVAMFQNLEPGLDFFLISLGEDSWYNFLFQKNIINTFRDAHKLGIVAANALLNHITLPMAHENLNIELEDSFDAARLEKSLTQLQNGAPRPLPQRYAQRLRLLLLERDFTTAALKNLLPQFNKQENIDIEVEFLSYAALYERLCADAERKTNTFDLASVDEPLLEYLASKGLFRDLSGLIARTGLAGHYNTPILDKICSSGGKILLVPSMYTLSLLCYRRDYFNDPRIAKQFCDTYRFPLAPPASWKVFNLVARFFTRAYNPDSPTEYGTIVSLDLGSVTAIAAQIYQRIWAYNGKLVDKNGFVRLYSNEVLQAYESFLETMRYCDPDAVNCQTNDGFERFYRGAIPMSVIFANNTVPFSDSTSNVLLERFAYAPIPGRMSAATGFGFGINSHSPNGEAAEKFLQWFTSMEIASSFSIVGGASPIVEILEHESLTQLYPWSKLVQKEYPRCVKRRLPAFSGAEVPDEYKVEEILVRAFFDTYRELSDLRTNLRAAHQALCELLESIGYPKNTPRNLV